MKPEPSRRRRIEHRAMLFDALVQRALSIRLTYPRGKLTVEADDPDTMSELLERVLTVLTSGSDGVPVSR